MAKMIKAKVFSGKSANESKVIRDGSRPLQARDNAAENWLHQDVAPAYDAMKADPSRGRSIGDVRVSLAAAHERTTKAG